MGIADLFRPKYRHSNAEVRAEAVRQLGPEQTDLVVKVAREDSDPSVRRTALVKIDDPDILVELARSESDRALGELARTRASGIWVNQAVSATDLARAKTALRGLDRLGDQRALADVASRAELLEVRDLALAELDEDRALADLVRGAGTHMAARTAALARIKDPDVLRSIAVDDQRKDIAMAAVERIDDPALLEAIAGKAKNKAARARARKKLTDREQPATRSAEPSGPSPEDKRRHAERVQLLATVERLSRGEEWTESAREMSQAQEAWEALGPVPADDTELTSRFERAVQRYETRRKQAVKAVPRKTEAQAGKDARPQAPRPERAARAAAAPDNKPARPSKPDQTGDASQVKPVAENQVATPAAATAPDAATPDTATAAAPPEPAPATPTPADTAEIAAAAASAPPEAAAPDAGAVDEEARKQERERKIRERKERDLAALTAVTEEMENLGAITKRKTAERLLQKADKILEEAKLPEGADRVTARFHEARQGLFIKIQDLREAEDWERWANVPRQEALIERARALLADEDENTLGDKLKALQNEWKDVGPVPQKKSQELWNQFKTTCDQVYERIKSSRARLAGEQAENLKRKEALCEKVEALAESTDWDATADEIKRLQREWKDIGPVPRKKSDAIWKRFRAACDKFFERRKPHLDELMAERNQNLAAKIALCEKAEALAESTDWKEASMTLRDLQREWRNIGPAPRKEAAEVQKRFKAACDTFFERRQKQRDEEKAARQRQIDEMRADMSALVAAVERGEEVADAALRTIKVRATLRELALEGAEKKAALTEANAFYRRMIEAGPDRFRGTELDPATSRQRKDKLLARVEEMAPPPQTVASESAPQTPEEMAKRLRAALAERALSGSLAKSTDSRATMDTISELRDAWLAIGPVPGAEGQALEQRFEAACERALRNAGVDSES